MKILARTEYLIAAVQAKDLTPAVISLLSLTGVLLILGTTGQYGVGTSPDSIAYMSAADGLLGGNGFVYSSGDLYIKWPPLFPMMLAVPGSLGIDGITGARFINALAFGGIIFGAGHLFRAHLSSRLLIIAGTVSILVSPALIRVSIKVWSEPLFTLFLVLFIYYLYRFIDEKKMAFLMLISILASLAFLQRYMGITPVLAGGFVIAFATRKFSVSRRLRYLSVFGLISVTPIAIWILRNYILTSSLTGDRSNPYHTVVQNLGRSVETLASWFVPNQILPLFAAMILLCIGALALLATVVGIQRRLDGAIQIRLDRTLPTIAFLLVYLIVLIFVSTRVFDPIAFRLLAPVYFFVMLLMFIGLETVAKTLNRMGQNTGPGIGWLLA